MTKLIPTSPAYRAFVQGIKGRIRRAEIGAALAANRELILLYWDIGREILARQDQEGWGAKVIDQLATDLRRAFPELKGFSARNLKYMRAFAEAWPEAAFVQQAVAQIPWQLPLPGVGYNRDLVLPEYEDHKDRLQPAFVEGHLAAVLDRGDITAIPRRLCEIREGGGSIDLRLDLPGSSES